MANATNAIPTIEDIEVMVQRGELKEHHTATRMGYVSRKSKGTVSNYSGRFGKGYIVDRPAWNSTQFHPRTYYVTQ